MTQSEWWLRDAEQTSREHPYTFYKPSQAVIQKLGPGSQVKLIFEFRNQEPVGPSAERMWVEITDVAGDRYRGVLRNKPVYIKGLALDDSVEFEEKHVIDTEYKDPDPGLVEKYIVRCFVTNRVLYGRERAGYLYREEPDEDKDSGWRLMVGDESDEYMNDPENISYVSLGAVLDRDASFIDLLDEPAGSAYRRNETTGRFESYDG